MIWRRSVNTRIFDDWTPTTASLVNLNGEAFDPAGARMITFGWTLASLADQEVWRRLAAGDFGPGGWRRSLVISNWNDEVRGELEDCLPPSEKEQFLLWLDPSQSLHLTLQPETEDICAAWNPKGRLLALGMASESAWEAMEGSLAKVKEITGPGANLSIPEV